MSRDGWWSRHLGGGDQQSQHNQTWSPSPAAHGGPPQQWAPTPQYYQQAPNQWAPQQAKPQVTVGNLAQVMGLWKGGEGAANSAHCPRCGSDHLFRRKVGQLEAAPLCYDCGYNGLWDQGDPSNYA